MEAAANSNCIRPTSSIPGAPFRYTGYAVESRDRPEHPGEHVDIVHAMLGQRATGGERRIVAPEARMRAANREIPGRRASSPRGSCRPPDRSPGRAGHRVDGREAHHQTDLPDARPRAPIAAGISSGVGRVHRKRLLAEDMLSGAAPQRCKSRDASRSGCRCTPHRSRSRRGFRAARPRTSRRAISRRAFRQRRASDRRRIRRARRRRCDRR